MNKKKKGFTLVELLVVIAILAILAAVSVVGYLSFTKKANLSNDQTTIKMLNDNLMAEFVEGKPKTAGEAMQGLNRLNIRKEKLTAYSNNYHYAYDLENMQMVLLDENDIQVYPEIKGNEDLWGLYMGSTNDNVNLSQYVALNSLKDKAIIENFVTKDITFDLNNQVFYINEDLNINHKITLKHGTYVPYDNNNNNNNPNIITDETIDKKEEVIEEGLLQKENYENVVFLFDEELNQSHGLNAFGDKNALILGHGITTTTFKNCTFVKTDLDNQIFIYNNHAGDHPYNSYIKEKEIVMDGCIVLNTDGLLTDVGNITVKNSKFIDSYHGLNLKSPTNKAVISNNIFEVRDEAISIQPEIKKDGYTKFNIDFSNNEINSKNVMWVRYSKHNKDENYKVIDLDLISFKNNNINITEDSVRYFAFPAGSEDKEDVKNYLLQMVEELKKIIK